MLMDSRTQKFFRMGKCWESVAKYILLEYEHQECFCFKLSSVSNYDGCNLQVQYKPVN